MKSKKPSRSYKRPDYSDLTFFVDRNLKNPEMVTLWERVGMSLVLHDSVFNPEADDDMWMPAVGANEWILITADKRLEREHLDTVIQSKIRALLLVDNNSGAAHWTAAIIRCLDQACNILRSCDRPAIIRVSKFGMITTTRGPEALSDRLNRFRTQRITRQKRHTKAS